jgi:NhaP-type Na+/H+ and K+/H+ antiporter
MALASLLSGLILYGLLHHVGLDWPFMTCWLTGVINSATDPVAVVALLKELGASKTLGTLIEGESLLNDGSAVVLYIFVKNVIGYDHATEGPSWMIRPDREIGLEFVRIVANMVRQQHTRAPKHARPRRSRTARAHHRR